MRRGTPLGDKNVRQSAERERNGRRRAALEEARRERERLEARLAREAEEPAVGRVPGAEWKPPELAAVPALQEVEVVEPARPRRKFILPAEDAEGTEWTMGEARAMLRQGYHLYRVQMVTGWGAKWLDDMPLDRDGFGLPL